jgi:drug/metabolite transporter (DMT)-like permease
MAEKISNLPLRTLAFVKSPYVALSFAILLWSGNFVVGRLANLDAPPVALSFWRHVLAAVMVAPFVIPHLARDRPIIRRHGFMFVVMCVLFVAGNTLVYFSILETTVINAALINAGLPVAAVFFSWIILRDIISPLQAVGIAACFGGIVVVVTRADLGVLLGLEFGIGDIFMLLAILCWALYMVLLNRAAIKVSPWTLLLVLSGGGALLLVPAYMIEINQGKSIAWTWLTGGSLIYVALFSTIIAWACWNYGTMRIGPNRASSFMLLHPMFGALLGMMFFAEALQIFHGVGMVLTLAGVYLVSRPKN